MHNTTTHKAEQNDRTAGVAKMLATAYTSWLLGGILGFHLLATSQPKRAFLYTITFGYCGIAWLLDIFYVPSYVRLVTLFVGALLGSIMTCLPPEELQETTPVDQYHLINSLCFGIGCTIGVYLAGNVEGNKLGIFCLVKYAVPSMLIFNSALPLTAFVVTIGAQRNRQFGDPPVTIQKYKRKRSVLLYYCKVVLFTSLLFTSVYNHGTYNSTDDNGIRHERRVKDHLHEFLNSREMQQIGNIISVLRQRVAREGVWELGHQFYTSYLQDSESAALATLGLDSSATRQEVKRAFRELSRRYHPDRLTQASEEEQEEATKHFIDIKNAYELLTGSNG